MIRHLVMLFLLATTLPVRSPDLSGTWMLDGFTGPGPLGMPYENAVCGAVPGPASPDGSTAAFEQATYIGDVSAELVIAQNEKTVTIDRKYGGSVASGTWKTVVNLDGSESTTANGAATSATRGKWAESRLVIEHRVSRNGTTCAATETFELAADGTLSVIATQDARTSRQTYFKKK
ncbi:MAG TPA: hypothetical protein VFV98_14740 [Vicinamibacterales bacterium]|nr:hypothetical protein [Vicinamibacterales bacterium]